MHKDVGRKFPSDVFHFFIVSRYKALNSVNLLVALVMKTVIELVDKGQHWKVVVQQRKKWEIDGSASGAFA